MFFHLIKWRLAALGAVCVLWAAGAQATTLKKLSGDEQIEQAAAIFRGRVERIEAARDFTKPRFPIFTTVHFTPLAVYKGAPPASLRFLGGSVGGVELKVGSMPKFEVGREYVLFVSGSANRACPVIGWNEGSLEVDRSWAAGGAVGIPPATSGWLGRTSLARSRSVMPRAMGLPQFESLLRQRIAEVSR